MSNTPMDRDVDPPDEALDALLRQHARPVPSVALADLESRILAQAAFPLAARRRDARTGVAETLAAWVRVALPLAAAAAIAAVFFLASPDDRMLADAELHESDPAALLSALEAEGSSGLAHHVISSDAIGSGAVEDEPQ